MDRMMIAIGTLLDPSGASLAWKRIRGLSEYVGTEDEGFFQLDLTGKETLYVNTPGGDCYLELPQAPESEYFHDYGDIRCKYR